MNSRFVCLTIIIIFFPSNQPQYLGPDLIHLPAPACKPNECTCPNSTFGPEHLEGDLKSPRGSDGNYCPYLDCNYTIAAGPKGTAIRIHFEQFRTETRVDYLEVNQTEDGRHIRLDRLSGNSFVPDFTSVEGNGFELSFHSNAEEQYRGFEAVFTRFNVSNTDCICPKIFHKASDQVQNITYPPATGKYCKRIKCYFVIKADSPYTVKLSLRSIDIDSHDKVSVYDMDAKYHVSSNELLRWTGRNLEKIDKKKIISRSHGFVVIFQSDSQATGKGFSAQFVQVTSPCHCNDSNRIYVSPSKENFLTSPYYPSRYCDDYDCTHTFYTNNSYMIQYEINNFSVAEYYDRLSVLEGIEPDSKRTLYAWRNGISVVGSQRILTTNSKESSLRFYTDFRLTAAGFNLTYRAMRRTGSCSCGTPQPFRFSETAGSTPSVVHDSNCPSIDCMYLLERPKDMKDLQLNFSVRAPEPYGHLALYKGGIDATEDVATWEGVLINETRTYGVTGDLYLLRYHSQANGTIDSFSGFNLSFQWFPPCECDSSAIRLTAEKVPKIITSPNFPSNYCDGLRCTYIIVSEYYGMNVVVSINSFKTEAENDYLKIFDGEVFDSIRYARYTKKYSGILPSPTVVRSTGRYLTLYFFSDESETKQGFSIEYYVEPPVTTTTVSTTTTTRTSTSTPTSTSTSTSQSTQKLVQSSEDASNSSPGTVAGIVTLVLLGVVAVCVVGYLFYTGRLTFKRTGVTHAYYNHRDSNLTLDEAEIENDANATSMI